MLHPSSRHLGAALAVALLCACAGNGQGLDSSGTPAGPGSGPDTPLTADFQSIQDNIFTPICVRCHSGAGAPEGLQLDAGHSYALLVGVASTEAPGLARVQPNDPDSSYLVQKLEGSAGIVGQRMPFGGPYLPQSTIDVVRQWITNGAQQSSVPAAAGGAAFVLTATSPPHQAVMAAPPVQLVVAFNHEVDLSLVNDHSVSLERLGPEGATPVAGRTSFSLAPGNAAAVLLQPAVPLLPGSYRLNVRGTGAAALADVDAQALGTDYVSEFTVKDPAP
jgi:hypothetical protein